jgi:hypothetical protein
MGRSFDRGGRSRKERERGKRHAYRQAERDREARDAVMQGKRAAAQEALAKRRMTRITTAAAAAGVTVPVASVTAQIVRMEAVVASAAAAERKRSGFLAQFFGRIFKKSA